MNIRIVVTALISGVVLLLTVIASAAPPSKTSFDVENARDAQTMLDEGQKTFRYETFGSEAFWGDSFSCIQPLPARRTEVPLPDIERQFEFVEQNWVLGPSFHGLRTRSIP